MNEKCWDLALLDVAGKISEVNTYILNVADNEIYQQTAGDNFKEKVIAVARDIYCYEKIRVFLNGKEISFLEAPELVAKGDRILLVECRESLSKYHIESLEKNLLDNMPKYGIMLLTMRKE